MNIHGLEITIKNIEVKEGIVVADIVIDDRTRNFMEYVENNKIDRSPTDSISIIGGNNRVFGLIDEKLKEIGNKKDPEKKTSKDR